MEGDKKPPAGTPFDVGKKDSNRALKQNGVPLSPFAAVVAGKSKPEEIQSGESSAVDCFNAKLRKLCESSGVPVIEDSKMDLYKLYMEVTERGGFQKVLKSGKWDEVTSAFNSSSSAKSMEASQLQQIYSNILYNYEQIYHYRSAKKDYTGEKRKYSELSCLPSPKDGAPDENRENSESPRLPDDNGAAVAKRRNSPKTMEEKLQREKGAPMSPRTAYQMYLKLECIRLRKMHNDGEDKTSGNINFRDIAIDAWRHLSQAEREPYVEESKKDKERFNKEMAAYKESKKKKKTENMTSEKKTPSSSSQRNKDDYIVKLGSVPKESAATKTVDDESTIKRVKFAEPSSSLFHISWADGKGSLDLT